MLGTSWVIRANINKMAAVCKPVVLTKLIKIVKRKIDTKK